MHVNQPQDSIQRTQTRNMCTQTLSIRQFPGFHSAINYYNKRNAHETSFNETPLMQFTHLYNKSVA